jgi:hypothetical protein
MDAATRDLAARLGYRLPAGSTHPDLICSDIAANMRRSVEAVLEIGKGLLVLKQACAHGSFVQRLETLSIERRLADKFMQAAVKFSNGPSTAHLLPKIDSQTKHFELLVLDDEQVDELAEQGRTGELKLDDVACMSVSELRKAVRKLRNAVEAKDKVSETNQKTIQKLQEQLVTKPPEPEADEDLPAPAEAEIADIEATVVDIETLAVRLMARVRALRAALPDTPARRARETSALMRGFAALRTTAIELEIAVSNDGEAEIDPEGGEEKIKRILQEQQRAYNRDHGIE